MRATKSNTVRLKLLELIFQDGWHSDVNAIEIAAVQRLKTC